MTEPKVTMPDHAWVWYDHDRETYLVDCPECGRYDVGPELYDGGNTGAVNHFRAIAIANLHNKKRHSREESHA